jgi:hypothetical protein
MCATMSSLQIASFHKVLKIPSHRRLGSTDGFRQFLDACRAVDPQMLKDESPSLGWHHVDALR